MRKLNVRKTAKILNARPTWFQKLRMSIGDACMVLIVMTLGAIVVRVGVGDYDTPFLIALAVSLFFLITAFHLYMNRDRNRW